MNRTYIILLLSIINVIHAGFSPETFIKTDTSFKPIEAISQREIILSFDLDKHLISNNTLLRSCIIYSHTYYRVHLEHDSITCSKNQKFYDPRLKQWVPVQEIDSESLFLDYYGNSIPCLDIEEIQSAESLPFYEITLNAPHTYFASQSHILTHNAFPIVVAFSWALGEGITLTGAGIGLGALGIGLWQKFEKNKKITFAQMQQEYTKGCAGGAPDPDDDKNRRRNSISKTEFFEKIKDQYDHLYDNVYKKKKHCNGINKAEYLEWDALHNDVEAYNKRKMHLGSIDPEKLYFYKEAIKGRRLN